MQQKTLKEITSMKNMFSAYQSCEVNANVKISTYIIPETDKEYPMNQLTNCPKANIAISGESKGGS